MKKLFLVAAFASLASFQAFGTTVTFGGASSGTARKTVLNDGTTALATGDLVLEGIFQNSGSFTYNPAISVLANVNNMVSLGFQPFGFAPSSYNSTTGTWTTDSSTSQNTLGIANFFGTNQVTGSIHEDTTVGGDASAFDNKQIYLVLFNGTTISGSSQMGIFTSTSWTFPTNTNGGSDVSPTYVTNTASTSPTVTAVAGTVTGATNSPGTLQLAATPEPSTLATLFGATGVLALLRRRRSE